MMNYVVGFLFNNKFGNKTEVVLIKKQKPEWQKGLLNGVGGKIEYSETPHEAMCREFQEETNMSVKDWVEFCVLTDAQKTWKVHFFMSYSANINVETTTDEEIVIVKVKDVLNGKYPIIKNLNWLIPMCLFDDANTYEIKNIDL